MLKIAGWKRHHCIILFIFVASGTANTLLMKASSRRNVTAYDGNCYQYVHPFVDNIVMFVGEMLCMVCFYILVLIARCRKLERLDSSKNEGTLLQKLTAGNIKFDPVFLFIPSFADLIASALMFVGFTLTSAANFQMMRGFILVCAAVLTRLFLKRRFSVYAWVGILVIIFGVFVVGLADWITTSEVENKNTALGNTLIVLAQIAAATKLVLEERVLAPYDIPPMFAVGCEGFYGFIMQSFLLIPAHNITWSHSQSPQSRLDDINAAISQYGNDYILLIFQIGYMFSIALYNTTSLSLVKMFSGTTKEVNNSIRGIFISIFTLAFGWDIIRPLQPVGYLFIIIGMLIYHEIITKKTFSWCLKRLTNCRKATKREGEEMEAMPDTIEKRGEKEIATEV